MYVCMYAYIFIYMPVALEVAWASPRAAGLSWKTSFEGTIIDDTTIGVTMNVVHMYLVPVTEDKNTPPDKKTGWITSLENTTSGAGLQLLLLGRMAKARRK